MLILKAMKLTKTSILMACVALGASGCVSSDSELAVQGDWEAIGYKDGIKGVTSRTVTSLNELGAAPIVSEYEQGYSKGIAEYCNPDFAYQIGLSGQYYEGVCEGMEGAQKFRMEWQRGWEESN